MEGKKSQTSHHSPTFVVLTAEHQFVIILKKQNIYLSWEVI